MKLEDLFVKQVSPGSVHLLWPMNMLTPWMLHSEMWVVPGDVQPAAV